MKKIYKFNVYCGRMGSIDSIFIADSEDVENIIGEDVYFGEILGKHSEINIAMENKHFTILSDDQDFISKAEEIFGTGTFSGHNPLDYCYDDENDNFDEEDEDDDE